MAREAARSVTRPFAPEYAVHPGTMIEEWLDESGMTQVEFADRIDMSTKALNQMIRGHAPVTSETSLKLESVTGIPARTWNALQALYAEDNARLERESELANQLEFLKQIPVKELRRRGYITAPLKDSVMILDQVCEFFGVASPNAWHRHWLSPAAAFRTSPTFEADPGAVATWLRLGELEARNLQLSEFDRRGLERALAELRVLTLQPDPKHFLPAIQSLCADFGVAVVFVPEVPGTRCSGASRWVNGYPIVQLSLRHKSDDQMWFTLFHELGHVLLHGKSQAFIDDGDPGSSEARLREDEANVFARDLLIPAQHSTRLRSLKSLDAIKSFASEIGVSPGVVVGRLQHDGLLSYRTGNGLKQRYAFVKVA